MNPLEIQSGCHLQQSDLSGKNKTIRDQMKRGLLEVLQFAICRKMQKKNTVINKLLGTYYVPCWLNMIHSHIGYICCKSLIQPQVIPPFHCHQVSKPLKTTHLGAVTVNATTMQDHVFN